MRQNGFLDRFCSAEINENRNKSRADFNVRHCSKFYRNQWPSNIYSCDARWMKPIIIIDFSSACYLIP